MSTKVNVINLTGHPVYSLPAADHGGESEDEVALADVVADAVAVHDEGAEAHEGLGGAAHLQGGAKIQNFDMCHPGGRHQPNKSSPCWSLRFLMQHVCCKKLESRISDAARELQKVGVSKSETPTLC